MAVARTARLATASRHVSLSVSVRRDRGSDAGHGGYRIGLTSSYFEDGDGGCADIGQALELDGSIFSGGEELTFRLADDARIGRWVIRYSEYPDGPVVTRLHSEPPHSEVQEVSVTGPSAGDWRISFFAELITAAGEGDATYEWRLSSMPDTATEPSADGTSLWLTWFVIPFVALTAAATLGLHRRRRSGDINLPEPTSV